MPFMITKGRTEDSPTLLSYVTARHCLTCKQFTHTWEDIGVLKRKLKSDCTLSFDGMHIVSEKFKNVLEQVSTSEINFYPVSKGSYVLRPVTEIFLDVTNVYTDPVVPGTGGLCPTCGRERAFFGYPDDGTILPGQKEIGTRDVVMVAQAIGSDCVSEQAIVVGDEVTEALLREKLISRNLLHEIQQPLPLGYDLSK